MQTLQLFTIVNRKLFTKDLKMPSREPRRLGNIFILILDSFVQRWFDLDSGATTLETVSQLRQSTLWKSVMLCVTNELFIQRWFDLDSGATTLETVSQLRQSTLWKSVMLCVTNELFSVVAPLLPVC